MANSPILGGALVSPTQNSKTDTINDFFLLLEASQNAITTIDMSGGNVTLSFTQLAGSAVFKVSGLTATRTLTIPLVNLDALPAYRVFLVRNVSSHSVVVGGATGASVTIVAGDAQFLESDGTDVIGFGSGGPGAPGAIGPPGGALDISYTFGTSTTDADPGNGIITFDHSTQNATTVIFVDLLDSAGSDWTAVLDQLDASTNAVKGQLRVFNRSDPTKWIFFNVTGRTTASGYRKLAVTVVGSSASNPFAASDALGFSFARTGDSDTSILTQNNLWTKAQQQSVIALTDGTSIAVDFSLGNNFGVTLGGNRTLAFPSNMPSSGRTQSGQVFVTQDGTGSRTLAFASGWHPVGGGSAPSLSTAAGSVDIISYTVVSPTYIKYSLLVG